MYMYIHRILIYSCLNYIFLIPTKNILNNKKLLLILTNANMLNEKSTVF